MKYILIALAIIAIALSFTFAKQGNYGIYGYVYKGEGPEKLGNATVEARSGGWSCTVQTSGGPEDFGYYEMSVPHEGTYHIYAYKDEGDTLWERYLPIWHTVYTWCLCDIYTQPIVE